jgi:putative tricarboxylic transport membrane protein
MLSRRDEILTGLGVMVLAALILWWLIPTYVALPRRAPLRALAPSFWPSIIGWTMLACGALLVARAATAPPPPAAVAQGLGFSRAEFLRLAALTSIFAGTYYALPVIGMVWASMAAFVLLVLLTGGRRLGWGVAAAVLLPLLLYLFFSKVAGVAIPQGQIVRLP